MSNHVIRSLLSTTLLLLAVAAAQAATAPTVVNYQGVLRDSGDDPLDGVYDMVFRFFGPSDDEILIDEHLATGTGGVTVAGGLFNVRLGTGAMADGSGPGTHLSLYEVFRDHGEVYLEVQIGADPGGETLSPRVRIVSAAYAMNTNHLQGLHPNQFLRGDTDDAFTFGTLTCNAGTTVQIDGTLNMDGPVSKGTTDRVANFNADLLDDLDSSSFSLVSHGHPGSDITGPVAQAVDADTVDGKHADEFIDISSTLQTKLGTFVADASAVASSYGVRGYGQLAGAYFADADGSGYARLGFIHRGIEGYGNEAGGYFQDLDGSGYALVGNGDWGITAFGNLAGGFFQQRAGSGTGTAYLGYDDKGIWGHGNKSGGFFQDADDTGLARVGYGDLGIQAEGIEAGGYFRDSDASGYAYTGFGDYGVRGFGNASGGYFRDANSSGYAHVGYGDYGVQGYGNTAGAYFEDLDHSGRAYVGHGDHGVDGYGSQAGGYFEDADSSGHAWVGQGNYGIQARGNGAGGYFIDLDQSGYALVGDGDNGITAYGNAMGGYFADNDHSGNARLGSGDYGIVASGDYAGGFFEDLTGSGYAYVGYFDEGISAHGTVQGGYFEDDDDTGQAHLAYGDYGIEASGNAAGGYFWDTLDTGYAYIGYGNVGVIGHGTEHGGSFTDTNSSGSAQVGYSTYKIYGTGTVSFVQNHPDDPDRVIVYAAPEGDEVAVYTRGTARLRNGEARIRLGETFQWVANPDIGLTAHVTPRGEWSDLYVESVSTEELIVGSGESVGDAAFDYIVYGLRIGFEELAVVQEKNGESYIPSMADHRELYDRQPDLRRYNALERFAGMESEVRGLAATELDLKRAAALKAAIEEYDPAVHGPVARPNGEDPGLSRESEEPVNRPPLAPREPGSGAAGNAGVFADRSETIEEATEASASAFAVSEMVEPGDVLVLDPDHPGQLRRADTAADPNVFGIAAAEPVEVDGQLRVEMVDSLYAVVRVDASYGVILAGDLLTCSPTPGHAMIAISPAPGTVVGKAAEPLESGTGLLKVLLMPR